MLVSFPFVNLLKIFHQPFMRKAGFYIKTVEESCEHFAIIDREIVWYGNINLLAKNKMDDSIMRVSSTEIASELMELTFGNNDRKNI